MCRSLSIPLANYGATAFSYFDKFGTITAIGERPFIGLFSESLQAHYSLAEMLTNMVGGYIGSVENIKCSVNWMWANNSPGEAIKLYNTAKSLTKAMKEVGVGIDGGKDSLSMMVKTDEQDIVSPGNVVITGYAPCVDINKGVTPDLKDIFSLIVYVPFVKQSKEFQQLKASIYSRVLNDNSNDHFNLPPTLDFSYCKTAFNVLQKMIGAEEILSLHDIGDGGLITTLFEMCYSGYKGIEIDKTFKTKVQLLNFLFAETPGVVLEISNKDFIKIRTRFFESNVSYELIGRTKRRTAITINHTILGEDLGVINLPIYNLCQYFEFKANQLELKQCNQDQVFAEYEFLKNSFKRSSNSDIFFTNPPDWYIPDHLIENLNKKNDSKIYNLNKHSILVLRDEGSNGDEEMCAFFKYAGFRVFNYNMRMFAQSFNEDGTSILDTVDGVVFVGGFTYSDIMGGAACWAAKIKNNDAIFNQLMCFFNNENKFVIGVCNGFQLLIKLGIFGENITLEENLSGRFESRFLPIEVQYLGKNRDYSKIFFDKMEDTVFGIWCAHKMGRIKINNDSNQEERFTPILKYTSNSYPLNLNGSDENIAGILSSDGRILGLMPHFERSFLKYQCAYIPPEYTNIEKTPWYVIAENIKNFLVSK